MAQSRDFNGYRSAHFGMTEAAVYTAIDADFAIPPESVERINNAIEKTSGMVISVADLVAPGRDHLYLWLSNERADPGKLGLAGARDQ